MIHIRFFPCLFSPLPHLHRICQHLSPYNSLFPPSFSSFLFSLSAVTESPAPVGSNLFQVPSLDHSPAAVVLFIFFGLPLFLVTFAVVSGGCAISCLEIRPMKPLFFFPLRRRCVLLVFCRCLGLLKDDCFFLSFSPSRISCRVRCGKHPFSVSSGHI